MLREVAAKKTSPWFYSLSMAFVLGLPVSALAAESQDDHQHSMEHPAQHAPMAEGDGHSMHSSSQTPLREGVRGLNGAEIYRKDCLACHGKSGAGDGPQISKLSTKVPNFTVAKAVVTYPRQKMIDALKAGHKGETEVTLPSYTDQQVEDVVTYVQDAFMLPTYESDASMGRQIYANTCSVCHGDRGNAASWAQNSFFPPPFDFTTYKAKKLSRRHMINTATYGSDNTAMVGWGSRLSKQEIASVVDYIRATFIFPDILGDGNAVASTDTHDHNAHGGGADGNEFDFSVPFANGLQANVENGKRLYEINCVACHGEKGAGDGPRAYFIFPRPENFQSIRARAELNRPHLYGSVADGIVGTVMPSWRYVLTEQEMTDIAEYVFQTFVLDGDVDSGAVRMSPSSEADQKKTTHTASDHGH